MSESSPKKRAISSLDQLKNMTVVVADTGDFAGKYLCDLENITYDVVFTGLYMRICSKSICLSRYMISVVSTRMSYRVKFSDTCTVHIMNDCACFKITGADPTCNYNCTECAFI